jgi:hypothetical protein
MNYSLYPFQIMLFIFQLPIQEKGGISTNRSVSHLLHTWCPPYLRVLLYKLCFFQLLTPGETHERTALSNHAVGQLACYKEFSQPLPLFQCFKVI